MFDFDSVIERHGTGSEKWDKYRGRDVIPMWVADMDFRSPPAVVDALRQRVEHGVFGYTGPTPEVVEASWRCSRATTAGPSTRAGSSGCRGSSPG